MQGCILAAASVQVEEESSFFFIVVIKMFLKAAFPCTGEIIIRPLGKAAFTCSLAKDSAGIECMMDF